MKIRSQVSFLAGSRSGLPRFAFVAALGAVVMSAAAHLSAPQDARRSKPLDRPVRAALEVEDAVAATLAPGRDGFVRFDGASLRGLDLGDLVAISPMAGLATETFEVSRRTAAVRGVTWWILDSTEFEESQAVLVELDGFASMWMQSPKFGDAFEWNFDPIARGRSIPRARATDLPGCGGVLDDPMGPEPPQPPAAGAARLGGPEDPECAGCGALDADIAFFYTPLVRAQVEAELEKAEGDPNDAPEVIELACAQECANATTAMANSDLPFGTRLVHVSEVAWDEPASWDPPGQVLDLFTGFGDGVLDEVHEIRDAVGADVCTLITQSSGGNGYCGIANLVTGGDNPARAFNNVVWDCTGGLVFAHEFGHNIGLCHAAGDGGGCGEETGCNLWEPEWAGCCAPDPTGPSTPVPSFNHGWRFVNELSVPACVCTVMAYGKTLDGFSSTRIPYYSNPGVDYLGTPTGSPEDDPDGYWADNARVIRANMPGTISYRCETSSPASPEGRLAPNGLRAADFFGQSIATNGLVMAAGAPRHDVSGTNAGAVFLFSDPDEAKGEDSEDLGWIQTGKITPSDLAEGDRFGESVSMDEDLLAVGAPYTFRYVIDEVTEEILEEHPLAGAASVWVADGAGGYCRLGGSIQPDDLEAYDLFGTSVAVAGDLLAVGAPRRDVGAREDAGAVWVYQRVAGGYELIEVLEGTRIDGRFGQSLAAAVQDGGDVVLLVGAPREVAIPGDPKDPRPYGQVHPFRYVQTGDTWIGVAGDPVQGLWEGGLFGSSLDARSADVIVGAPQANEGRGAARTYRMAGAELANARTIELGADVGDETGTAVAITDTFAAVSVPGFDVTVEVDDIEIELEDLGMAAVFQREPGDLAWGLRQICLPPDLRPGDRFGASLALAGNRLFVGAPEGEDDDAGPLSGVVYVKDLTAIEDCNENGVDDSVDIFTGDSIDENGNGIPDECDKGDCAADLNGDGIVEGADLGLLLMAWGACPGAEPGCPGDLDLDGVVDGADVGLFCSSWGLVCEPPAP